MILDEKYAMCESCHHFSRETWKGENWEACRRWGFRLTERVEEPDRCKAYTTTENYIRQQRAEMEANKRKKKSK